MINYDDKGIVLDNVTVCDNSVRIVLIPIIVICNNNNNK
jgi:hypothetical protein